MTLVDPFVPVKKQPLPGLVNNFPRPKAAIKPARPAPANPVQYRPLSPAKPAASVTSAPIKAPQVARMPQATRQQPAITAQYQPQPAVRPQAIQKPSMPQSKDVVVTPASAAPRPLAAQPPKQAKPVASPPVSTTPLDTAKQKTKRRRSKRERLWTIALKLRIPAAFAAMFVGGMLLQSLIFGQVAILAYAILAFVRRIPSSTTITLAGISLLSIIVLNVKDPFNPLIGTFAVYAFLLLTIGVITLVREIYGQNKETSKA